jgi:polyhydroxybutyrate depolymerase
MRLTTICLLLVLPVAIPGRASAEETPRADGGNALLRRFDTDGDGRIDDAERRAAREALRARQSRPGATTPSGKTEIVEGRHVTDMEYPSSDGRKIPCVLSMPQGDGPFPVVVTIHGGQGDRDLGYLGTMAAPNKASPTVSALNGQPWAVLAISYRAGDGAVFGAEHDDVIAGIRFAKTLPKVDPDRVGVVGGSHGGHLALVAAEKMGREFRCVVACSPWMVDPVVAMTGDPAEPPLSLVPEGPRQELVSQARRLFRGLMRNRGLSEEEARRLIARESVEANAGKIEVPVLFVTSRGDDQAPHALIEPTIRRLTAAGKDVAVYTAEKSPHGFYWARTVSAARAIRGEKTPEELAEETAARDHIIRFFTEQFAEAKDAVSQPAASAETDMPARGPDASPTPGAARRGERPRRPAGGDGAGSQRRPTPAQADAVRRLRDRMADMPVPPNLVRRTLDVGGRKREFFINVPARAKGRPAPVVFALHGGASSSGLAMHLKADYTKLGEQEGYVTVYPGGVNGWNIGSHDMLSVKRRTSDADDLGFFRVMFDTLVAEKIADPRRIYVTGGSNGGVMTQRLVCECADQIAGAGVLVATLPRAAAQEWPAPARPMPIMIMLGTDDPMKPWGGSKDQMSAEETVAFWRDRNGCKEAAATRDLPDRDPADGCRVRVSRWEGEAPVVFYKLEGHGHGWPMQRGDGGTDTGPKTRDISAPEEFWTFLREQAL